MKMRIKQHIQSSVLAAVCWRWQNILQIINIVKYIGMLATNTRLIEIHIKVQSTETKVLRDVFQSFPHSHNAVYICAMFCLFLQHKASLIICFFVWLPEMNNTQNKAHTSLLTIQVQIKRKSWNIEEGIPETSQANKRKAKKKTINTHRKLYTRVEVYYV